MVSRSSALRWVGAIVVVGLGLGLLGQPAQAGPLYFSSAASSTWIDDSATADWSATSGGLSGVYTDSWWLGGSDAWFEGTAGTVNVSGTIGSVNSLNFSVDGYTLSGGTINLTGAGGNITTGPGTDTIGSAADRRRRPDQARHGHACRQPQRGHQLHGQYGRSPTARCSPPATTTPCPSARSSSWATARQTPAAFSI